MAGTDESLPPRIAGRVRELEHLESAVARAVAHEPSVTFVHGEAGVGKTVLAQQAVRQAQAAGAQVLWGQCLRFGAGESPMHPWVIAWERWFAVADESGRAEVLATPGAEDLLPSLGGRVVAEPVRLVRIVETLVARIQRRHPLLVVIDDVQWADAASRDALTYLVAGFGSERVAVVATCRDEGLPMGDPVHGWLADLRRLPRVEQLHLERLDRVSTEQQLRLLLRGDPTPQLVEAVHHRSGGNAYLTELLVDGLEADAEVLPPDLPAVLGDALLATWHRLPATARNIVRVLAVAGRPTSVRELAGVCAALDITDGELSGPLAAAADGGIVVPLGADRVWLRHPLLADVLDETFTPGESARVHRAWARALVRHSGVGVDEVRRLGDLARHHQLGGNPEDAFQASMAAARHAALAGMWEQEALHLRRATSLWPNRAPDSDGLDEAGLFERAAIASLRVGEEAAALEAGRRALQLVLAEGDVLRISRLTSWCADTAWWLGETDREPVEDHRAALAMTRDFPDSRERAEALAALSQALSWSGLYEPALAYAEEAVAVAVRSGSLEAKVDALDARALAREYSTTAEPDTRLAYELATRSGDPDRIQWAVMGRINFMLAHGRLREVVALSRAAVEAALRTGMVASAGWHSSGLAAQLADRGRLRESAEVIRTGLTLVGPGNDGAAMRLAAARVSVRRGDLRAAGQHLQRAVEQIPSLEARPGLLAPPVLAEHLCGQGRPREALSLLRRTMPAHAVDPRVCDAMMMWVARAAADLAEVGRLRRSSPHVDAAGEALRDLVRLRAGLPGEPFHVNGQEDVVQPALRAVFEAEAERCETGASDPDAWATASELCSVAGLGWEQHLAAWRLGEALLARGNRSDAAASLRTVHEFARAEGADQLRDRVAELARISRVDLAPVALPEQRAPDDSPLAALTAREREVLGHLVAGHTYAEIAELLFISEKTVSTHVSHVLAKTGTSSRREAAALALSLGRIPD